jgi:hypothetical protein
MSQPVKLSDALVLDARLAGGAVERSIAGQVEFWARIGRAVERLLQGEQVLVLCRNAAAHPLSDRLASVDSPQGRRRVTDFLQTQPYPHYESHPDKAGLLSLKPMANARWDASSRRGFGTVRHDSGRGLLVTVKQPEFPKMEIL